MLTEFQAELLKHRNKTEKDNPELSINEKFTQFADYIREHGKEYFVKDHSNQKNNKEWFTQEIKEMVDKNTEAYVQW